MERLGDAVREQVARFGPAAGMARIVEVWPSAVGPAIAANAWPARLDRSGTLHVNTSSSTWAFELGQLAGEILPRLSGALGEDAPAALRFVPGHLPEPAVAPLPGPTLQGVQPGPEDEARARELTASLESADLRELAAKAASFALARAAADHRF